MADEQAPKLTIDALYGPDVHDCIRAMAVNTWTYYHALIEQGFTATDAIRLAEAWVTTMMTASVGQR